MSKKQLLFVIGLLLTSMVFCQNKPLLFGFAETPTTLLLNPGAETNFNYHVGVPMLSGISLSAGLTGGTLSALFLEDGIPFNTKFERLTNTLTNRNFLSANVQVDVLNGGYRLDEKTYLSFGMYQEVDFIGYYPKDILELLYYGNEPFLNKTVHFSDLKVRGEILGVLHAGLSHKVNKKLNIGGRFKLYSGSLQVMSTTNSGTFNTELGIANRYRHRLNAVGIGIQSSGFYNANEDVDVAIKEVLGNTLMSKNIGVGVDVGFTYHYTPQIEFTGSLLDVGFVSYTKNTKNLSITGDYEFDGIELLYDSNNTDYWSQLDRDFKANVPRETDTDAFVSWRPIKLNAAVAYSFGRARINKECYDETYKEYYNNAVGLQLFAVTRPLSTQVAATFFLDKSISEYVHAKFTYTLDDFSKSNIGAGLSAQIGIVQVYGMFGNVLKFSDLAVANTASLDFGIHLIFD